MSTDYKPNSHRSKEGGQMVPVEDKKIEKVVRGKVKTKPKSGVHKFTDVFIAEDLSRAKSYVISEVVIPSLKKAISEAVREGIDMILFGESRGRRSSGNSSYVSYRDYSRRDDYRSRERDPGLPPRTRGTLYDDIILETRGEAEDVLTRMDELIDTYGAVSIGDLYALIGRTDAPYTAERYGWHNIASAEPVRVRDGYLLKLPKAIPID